MAEFDAAPQHNMVALLSHDGTNPMFHPVMDFFSRSTINYALTVAPRVATSWVEAFWRTSKATDVNGVPFIIAKVAGKRVVVNEALIRSTLQFNDLNGVYKLPISELHKYIRQMRYEGDYNAVTLIKGKFCPHWKFFFHTLNHCISPKSTSWD